MLSRTPFLPRNKHSTKAQTHKINPVISIDQQIPTEPPFYQHFARFLESTFQNIKKGSALKLSLKLFSSLRLSFGFAMISKALIFIKEI